MYVDFKDWLLESYEEGWLTEDMLRMSTRDQTIIKSLWDEYFEQSDVLDDCQVEAKELLRQIETEG